MQIKEKKQSGREDREGRNKNREEREGRIEKRRKGEGEEKVKEAVEVKKTDAELKKERLHRLKQIVAR